jgi:hypothetical protein
MKHSDIGAYGVTFNKKSNFIYKTPHDSEGFFIRKKNWINLINNDDSQEINELIKTYLATKNELICEKYLKNLKEQDLKIVEVRNGPVGVI